MENLENKEVKNGYSLHRQWFDFAFENPDLVSPVHTAVYLWLCELNNRMGWAEKFGAPSSLSMSAVGIKHHSTYKKALDDLIQWNFVRIIEKSKNQYSANVISLTAMSKNSGALSGALDKALSGAHSEAHAIYINNKPKTIKPEKTLPKNSAPTKQIISLFLKTFPDYTITAHGKEGKAAKNLWKVWQKQNSDKSTEESLQLLESFFIRCKTIKDPWLRDGMSLSVILSQYTAINRKLNDRGGNPASKDITKEVYSSNL